MNTATRSSLTALVSAALTGGLLTTAMASAPHANATCASFFGLGNSLECSSTITSFAIAIGPGAEAHAGGWFGGTVAVGTSSYAETTNGVFNAAIALGDAAAAGANGVVSLALGAGNNAYAESGLDWNDGLNASISIGNTQPTSTVKTDGVGNLALSLLGDGDIASEGLANTAINAFGNNDVEVAGSFNVGIGLGGNNNEIQVTPLFGEGNFSTAFAIGGSDNDVEAGPGPFALAGAILQSNANISKSGPGFNINGIVVGGAAATSGKKKGAKASSVKKSAASSPKSTGGSARK